MLKQTASVTPDLEQVVGAPLLMGEWVASMALCQPRPTVVVNVLMAVLGTAKQSAKGREGSCIADMQKREERHKSTLPSLFHSSSASQHGFAPFLVLFASGEETEGEEGVGV